jgi:hypothetical protein
MIVESVKNSVPARAKEAAKGKSIFPSPNLLRFANVCTFQQLNNATSY